MGGADDAGAVSAEQRPASTGPAGHGEVTWLRVGVSGSQPFAGTVESDRGGGPLEFAGWAELMALITEICDDKPPSAQ